MTIMEAEAEPVFPLLALPPDVVDRIAYLLPPSDRCAQQPAG